MAPERDQVRVDKASVELPAAWLDEADVTYSLTAVPVFISGPRLPKYLDLRYIGGLRDMIVVGGSEEDFRYDAATREHRLESEEPVTEQALIFLSDGDRRDRYQLMRIVNAVNRFLKDSSLYADLSVSLDISRLEEYDRRETIVNAETNPNLGPLAGERNPAEEILAALQGREASPEDVALRLVTRIGSLGVELREMNEALDYHVQAARLANVSWRKIGEAIGISSTSAYRRWDPEAKRKHAEYYRSKYRGNTPDEGSSV